MAGLNATHFLHEVRLARDGVPSFDQYPFNLPAVRHLDRLELHPNVTFLVGENGSGKSTLVEAIAVARGSTSWAPRARSASPTKRPSSSRSTGISSAGVHLRNLRIHLFFMT